MDLVPFTTSKNWVQCTRIGLQHFNRIQPLFNLNAYTPQRSKLDFDLKQMIARFNNVIKTQISCGSTPRRSNTTVVFS